jgi:hypothetical protein
MSRLVEPAQQTHAMRPPLRGAAATVAGMFAVLCLGTGLAAGLLIGRHTAPAAPPALLQPVTGQPVDLGSTAAAQRAIALVVGQSRVGDGMTFDQWYRVRLNRLAPGIHFRYTAQLLGDALCGYWDVGAIGSGPSQPGDADVLNQYGRIAEIDELSGEIVRPNDGSVQFATGDCISSAPAATSPWYGEFLAGRNP